MTYLDRAARAGSSCWPKHDWLGLHNGLRGRMFIDGMSIPRAHREDGASSLPHSPRRLSGAVLFGRKKAGRSIRNRPPRVLPVA
jgi:hypothetical protein